MVSTGHLHTNEAEDDADGDDKISLSSFSNSSSPSLSPSSSQMEQNGYSDCSVKQSVKCKVKDKKLTVATSPSSVPDEKTIIRRQRNKIAATRCRQKKRKRIDNLLQEIRWIEEKNQDTEREIKRLQLEKETYENIVKEHDQFFILCTPIMFHDQQDIFLPTTEAEIADFCSHFS